VTNQDIDFVWQLIHVERR